MRVPGYTSTYLVSGYKLAISRLFSLSISWLFSLSVFVRNVGDFAIVSCVTDIAMCYQDLETLLLWFREIRQTLSFNDGRYLEWPLISAQRRLIKWKEYSIIIRISHRVVRVTLCTPNVNEWIREQLKDLVKLSRVYWLSAVSQHIIPCKRGKVYERNLLNS